LPQFLVMTIRDADAADDQPDRGQPGKGGPAAAHG
jgi:hypothetical protein